MDDTAEMVKKVVEDACMAAFTATQEFLNNNGNADLCGFAWVTVYEKGSTRIGRALLKAGFRKDYGSGLKLWNPSGHHTQCITAKEEGAMVAARILSEKLGVKAYANSRLD